MTEKLEADIRAVTEMETLELMRDRWGLAGALNWKVRIEVISVFSSVLFSKHTSYRPHSYGWRLWSSPKNDTFLWIGLKMPLWATYLSAWQVEKGYVGCLEKLMQKQNLKSCRIPMVIHLHIVPTQAGLFCFWLGIVRNSHPQPDSQSWPIYTSMVKNVQIQNLFVSKV